MFNGSCFTDIGSWKWTFLEIHLLTSKGFFLYWSVSIKYTIYPPKTLPHPPSNPLQLLSFGIIIKTVFSGAFTILSLTRACGALFVWTYISLATPDTKKKPNWPIDWSMTSKTTWTGRATLLIIGEHLNGPNSTMGRVISLGAVDLSSPVAKK